MVTVIYGDKGTAHLLLLSQVILSMQLRFAVIPLVRFVSDKRQMGVFVIRTWVKTLAWLVTGVIVALNVKLLADTALR